MKKDEIEARITGLTTDLEELGKRLEAGEGQMKRFEEMRADLAVKVQTLLEALDMLQAKAAEPAEPGKAPKIERLILPSAELTAGDGMVRLPDGTRVAVAAIIRYADDTRGVRIETDSSTDVWPCQSKEERERLLAAFDALFGTRKLK